MDRIFVTSNNGRIHLSEYKTKIQNLNKTPKELPGVVRKLCDGQWVDEKKQVQADKPTCIACLKVFNDN